MRDYIIIVVRIDSEYEEIRKSGGISAETDEKSQGEKVQADPTKACDYQASVEGYVSSRCYGYTEKGQGEGAGDEHVNGLLYPRHSEKRGIDNGTGIL